MKTYHIYTESGKLFAVVATNEQEAMRKARVNWPELHTCDIRKIEEGLKGNSFTHVWADEWSDATTK